MLKTKIRQRLSLQRLIALIVLCLLFALSLVGSFSAQTPFTQGYSADAPLQTGMIVRLKPDDTSKVQPLSRDNVQDMHGVVVNANDAAVTLSAEGQKVFVATAGHYDVLVSSQNGTIKPGDYLTISVLGGVGMKADDQQPLAIGQALTAFDQSTPSSGTTKIKDAAGGEREVNLARIQANISISRNPHQKGAEANLPEVLQRASQAIAGKPVDPARVYVGLVVFIITTSITGSLLYAGVRSGIISIGRNPLSKKLIIRGMFQVVVAGLIIFIVGLFGVYLLLRL